MIVWYGYSFVLMTLAFSQVCHHCRDEEMRDSVSNQRLVDVLLALFGHHIALLEGPSVPEKDQIRFNIAGDSVRMMFQLTTGSSVVHGFCCSYLTGASTEYGPLSSRNAKAARAYPMTSESKKLEDQIMSESPVPEHIQFLFKNSVELLKRALLLDFHDPNRRQLQVFFLSLLFAKKADVWFLTSHFIIAAVVHVVRPQPTKGADSHV